MPSAIYRALGKAFAEYHISTWQRKVDLTETAHLTSPLPSGDVSGTRQNIFFIFSQKILCRVPQRRHSAKCPILPSALDQALGKVPSFAECHDHSTRQIWDLSRFCTVLPSFAECCCHGTRQRHLCRVLHSAKLGIILFFVFCFPSLQTNKSHIHNHHMPRITIYIT